jgi:hypothetical protein
MRIHRGLLFWGLFLIPLGTIPLLARANVIDVARIGEAWRFWPLILVGVGLAILLGRSRASIVVTVVLALVLGGVAGATLAAGPAWIGSAVDCGAERATDAQLDRNGTFSRPAEVNLDLRCGSVDVTTAAGAGWSVHASYGGAEPTVDSSASKLELDVPDGRGVQRQHWTVTAPVDLTDAIKVRTNAGTARLLLDGARLSRLEADLNAGDLVIDGGSAMIARLDVQMNAGRARITLGDSGPVTGSLSMNAGAIELCVPAGLELRLRTKEQLTFVNNLAQRGLTRDGDAWHRAGTPGSPAIDLAIEGNAANLTLDPDGGCK